MGTTTASVSVAEYRRTVYEPDMDYVDGELEDRHVGELDHSILQGRLLMLLSRLGTLWVLPELRLQVGPTRFRIPDLCVYAEQPTEQVPTVPPVLVVEVLSPEDRWPRVHKRLQDFAAMGCPCVWVLDPQAREAFRFDGTVAVPVTDELAHPSMPALRLRLADVFPA